MTPRIPFIFGIPLIARAAARDFGRVQGLLSLTLRSILAQSDPEFRVLVMGHDRPDCLPDDARLTFLRADWPAAAPDGANNDAGCKKHAIGERVMAEGGGLLMWVDADDWISRDLVACARAEIREDHVGGVLSRGIMADFRSLRAAPLPCSRLFTGAYYQLCGSSVVARLRPGHPDPLRRNPCEILRAHHVWPAQAAARGARVARLSARGCYVVNTRENHSEAHGPFAAWRCQLNAALGSEGRTLDDGALAVFGLDRGAITRAGGGPAAGPVPPVPVDDG